MVDTTVSAVCLFPACGAVLLVGSQRLLRRLDMKFEITKNCVVTHKSYTVFVQLQDFVDWQERRKLAQNAFPYLSTADREFIISGISPDGWDQIFTEDASDES